MCVYMFVCVYVLVVRMCVCVCPALTTIPEAIKECKSLLTLDLSCNPLGDLCEGLMELRQLRKLHLNDIQLEELPPAIGKLVCAKKMGAVYNTVLYDVGA